MLTLHEVQSLIETKKEAEDWTPDFRPIARRVTTDGSWESVKFPPGNRSAILDDNSDIVIRWAIDSDPVAPESQRESSSYKARKYSKRYPAWAGVEAYFVKVEVLVRGTVRETLDIFFTDDGQFVPRSEVTKSGAEFIRGHHLSLAHAIDEMTFGPLNKRGDTMHYFFRNMNYVLNSDGKKIDISDGNASELLPYWGLNSWVSDPIFS